MKRGRPRNNQGRNQNRKPNPNRALESNGPGIKVRGAASTIFEKYTQMAHDATTSGDRVSAEYYYQYAEHYGRLVQAQVREREQREEEQRAQRDARQAEYDARKANRQAEQPQQSDASQAKASDPKASDPKTSDEMTKPSKPRRVQKPAVSAELPANGTGLPDSMLPEIPVPSETVSEQVTAPVRRVRRRRVKAETPTESSES